MRKKGHQQYKLFHSNEVIDKTFRKRFAILLVLEKH